MARHSPKPEWTYNETKKRILSIENPDEKVFSAITYSTGARLNETLNLRPKDIRYENGQFDITILTLKHYRASKVTGKKYGEKWETRTIP